MKTSNFATVVTLLSVLALPALAEGDAENGEKVFRKCKACHKIGDDAKNGVGPLLTGIVGAPAAANPDFSYSDAMVEAAAGGLVWDDETLALYLKKPRDLVKGTKMTFAGLRKDDDIEDVIAYLESFQ